MKRKPDLRPRLRMEIAELAHQSRVWVEPGPDDWFPEVDISQFVQRVDLHAKVGDATTAQLQVIRVDATATALLDGLISRELVPGRWHRVQRWFWRIRFHVHAKLRESKWVAA